jgi:hypothetical protein
MLKTEPALRRVELVRRNPKIDQNSIETGHAHLLERASNIHEIASNQRQPGCEVRQRRHTLRNRIRILIYSNDFCSRFQKGSRVTTTADRTIQENLPGPRA